MEPVPDSKLDLVVQKLLVRAHKNYRQDLLALVRASSPEEGPRLAAVVADLTSVYRDVVDRFEPAPMREPSTGMPPLGGVYSEMLTRIDALFDRVAPRPRRGIPFEADVILPLAPTRAEDVPVPPPNVALPAAAFHGYSASSSGAFRSPLHAQAAESAPADPEPAESWADRYPGVRLAEVNISLSRPPTGGVFVDVREGDAADRAGIADGARLLEVDGVSVREWFVSEVKERLRGALGTPVEVLWSNGAKSATRTTLKRTIEVLP